jgi:GTP cyclohydrolase I
VKATGSRTITSALRGVIQDDPRTRGEFMAFVGRS